MARFSRFYQPLKCRFAPVVLGTWLPPEGHTSFVRCKRHDPGRASSVRVCFGHVSHRGNSVTKGRCFCISCATTLTHQCSASLQSLREFRGSKYQCAKPESSWCHLVQRIRTSLHGWKQRLTGGVVQNLGLATGCLLCQFHRHAIVRNCPLFCRESPAKAFRDSPRSRNTGRIRQCIVEARVFSSSCGVASPSPAIDGTASALDGIYCRRVGCQAQGLPLVVL